MKRALLLILALLLSLLVACSPNNATPKESDPSTSVSNPTSTAPSESVTEENTTADIVESTEPTSSTEPTPAVSVPPQTSQKPKDNPPPATSKPTDPPKTNPPATSEPPTTSTPTEPPKPTFNAQTYYDYALSYGKSIGLKYYPDMNLDENAWNAPVNLYSALTDDTMKKNVRSSCDFIKREGFEYFGLYLEKQPDGTSYRLYVMYG